MSAAALCVCAAVAAAELSVLLGAESVLGIVDSFGGEEEEGDGDVVDDAVDVVVGVVEESGAAAASESY